MGRSFIRFLIAVATFVAIAGGGGGLMLWAAVYFLIGVHGGGPLGGAPSMPTALAAVGVAVALGFVASRRAYRALGPWVASSNKAWSGP